MNTADHTYEYGISHIVSFVWVFCKRAISHMNEAWHTCVWGMTHVCMRHDTRVYEAWHTCVWIMRQEWNDTTYSEHVCVCVKICDTHSDTHTHMLAVCCIISYESCDTDLHSNVIRQTHTCSLYVVSFHTTHATQISIVIVYDKHTHVRCMLYHFTWIMWHKSVWINTGPLLQNIVSFVWLFGKRDL